jgi:lipoate-protein ligase A
MPDTLFLLDYREASGPLNMGLDAALAADPPERPVLRLYGWKTGDTPGCITLGRFQKPAPEILDALAPFGVTRRTTGGGAIYHWGEVTYSITGRLAALRLAEGREAAYARYHGAWIAALAAYAGIERRVLWTPAQRGDHARADGEDRLWCFSRRTGYDVLVESGGALPETSSLSRVPEKPERAEASSGVSKGTGHPIRAIAARWLPSGQPPERKIIGSAQRLHGDVLLQHGSIKVRPSPLAPCEIGLEELGGRAGVEMSAVAAQLAETFAKHLGYRLEPWKPSRRHIEHAMELAESRFASTAWIRDGRKPKVTASLG